MIWADNSTGHPRVGLIVPRFRATAVARNRLRRRLKEIWRREVGPTAGSRPVDLVIRTRPSAYAAPFDALRADLLSWRRVAGIEG